MNWFICCCILTLVLRNDNVISAFILDSPHSSVSCDHLPEYNNLIKTLQHNPCISDTQIWQMLTPLHEKSHNCLRQLITVAAGYVESHNIDGTGCHCSHKFDRDHVHSIGHNHDNYWTCVVHNSNCEYLFNYFYLRTGQTHAMSQCQSYSHVWTHLKDIRNHLEVDAQTDIILHLAQTFSKGHENVCTCTKAEKTTTTTTTTTSTARPTTSTSTSTVAPTTPMQTTKMPTTKNSPTTVAPLSIIYRCNHAQTIVAVAYQTQVSHTNASMCAEGQHTSHEAFVLTECDAPHTPSTWKQGVNVMSRCVSSNPIPDNTPIASFDHGLYSSVGSLSGIFLGCTSDGFKIAYQTCSQSPEITELRLGESFNRNPNNYFAIS